MTQVHIDSWCDNGIHMFRINSYMPVVEFGFSGRKEKCSILNKMGIGVSLDHGSTIITKPLSFNEHIYGLGERAYDLDRRMGSFRSLNSDSYAYSYKADPLYASIPFFISVLDGIATGFFFNFPGEIKFDMGSDRYDWITITVSNDSLDFYVLEGPEVSAVIERYTDVTGKPLVPPQWTLEHQISRYSYFPASSALSNVSKYIDSGFPVGAVYLDIDYQDRYNTFTWGKDFGDHRELIRKLKDLGVRLITIVDPYVKADQNQDLFRDSLGMLCERKSHELYLERSWPGLIAFFDFFSSKTREFWGRKLVEWYKSGISGVWIDMNEFSPSKTAQADVAEGGAVVFNSDNGPVDYSLARNAYPYYEAMAAYQALRSVESNPFVLSRSGYSGIQKYAFLWTGDNPSSWDDLRMQISLVLSLGLSGVPFTGCDLGGFVGHSTPELIEAYYRVAMFFPFYRNHKSKGDNDQELFRLPEDVQKRTLSSIRIRYLFIPYLYSLELESSVTGHPVLRPMFYEFQKDENAYAVRDQMMIGHYVLYAPQIDQYSRTREVYLPEGKWYSFLTGEEFIGPATIETNEYHPIYIRENAVILLRSEKGTEICVTGTGSFEYPDVGKVISEGGYIRLQRKSRVSSIILYGRDPHKRKIIEFDPPSENLEFRI
ncbi:MAG: hypothetical protein M1605_01155 [Candidatus Thermoplasmatota archaeon]|nr:hypothetical protein [Candidatus Thermoplasmatota archaeon]